MWKKTNRQDPCWLTLQQQQALARMADMEIRKQKRQDFLSLSKCKPMIVRAFITMTIDYSHMLPESVSQTVLIGTDHPLFDLIIEEIQKKECE